MSKISKYAFVCGLVIGLCANLVVGHAHEAPSAPVPENLTPESEHSDHSDHSDHSEHSEHSEQSDFSEHSEHSEHSNHSTHESIGETVTERLAYMSAHFHAGLILYRNGQTDMAVGHLSHPVTELHAAEWQGLDEYGFDQSLFAELLKAISSGSAQENVDFAIGRAIVNLNETAERVETSPEETLHFLLATAETEYQLAVVDGEIVNKKVYQDIAGYLSVADYWKSGLPDEVDPLVSKGVEHLVQMHRDASKSTPITADDFSDQIRQIVSKL